MAVTGASASKRTALDDAFDTLSKRCESLKKEGGRYSVLSASNYDVKVVLSVDQDSILYVTKDDQPRTAWLHVEQLGAGRTRLHMTSLPGFVSDPPKGWHG